MTPGRKERAVGMGLFERGAVLAAAGAALAIVMSAPATAEPGPPVPPAPPAPGVEVQPVAAAGPPPAAGVPHLPSPENLPPGTSDVPTGPAPGRGLSYLQDLWHAMQTQEVSGRDALLLLTQRPLDPDAVPPPHLPAGPQPPVPALPPPAPAPVPPPLP